MMTASFLRSPFPGPCDLTVDNQRVLKKGIAARIQLIHMRRVEDGASVSIADDIFIIIGQQVRGLTIDFYSGHGGSEPVGSAIHHFVSELRLCHFDSAPNVGPGQSRPPDEIFLAGWPVTREVAAAEFSQCFCRDKFFAVGTRSLSRA